MADDPVLADLAAACPDARPAGPSDTVAGVMPRYVAAPASVAEASALLRAAAGRDLTVVPRGGGSRLHWGAPPARCDLVVGTSRLDRVLEHAAGDLVARVQAGVPVSRLAEMLGSAGQRLALDEFPAGTAARSTAGGTLATGVAGPRRLRYGSPRDLLIGITVVRADGTIASAGGKVVKNVAGYDLGKLFAGSYGTLGLIVEAVFRLHPRPAAVAYTTLGCQDVAAAHQAVAAAAGSDLAPTAIEIDRPRRGGPVRVGVLLEGDPRGTADRAAALRDLLGGGARTSAEPPAWWGQTGGGASAGALVKIAFWSAALPEILAVIDAAGGTSGADPAVGGSAAAGVLYAALDGQAGPERVAAFVSALRSALGSGQGDAWPAAVPPGERPPAGASASVLYAPPGTAGRVDLSGPVPGLPLMRAVKDQFDPGHRMAPGRFVGGI